MPNFEDMTPEEAAALREQMERRRYEGLSPEEAERRKAEENAARAARAASFEETLSALETGRYPLGGKETALPAKEELGKVRVYLPGDIARLEIPDPLGSPCSFSCVNEDSLAAAKRLASGGKRPMVLNMASPTRPGGGVREGANGQEESLCRRTTLYLSIGGGDAKSFYALGGSADTRLGTNAVTVSPCVAVLKDGDEKWAEPFGISVISCAAPMVRLGLEGRTQEEYEDLLFTRCMGLLKCAAAAGARDLVLGAFGCGAFGNDPALVAGTFRKLFSRLFADRFESVTFAVLCRDEATDVNFRAFEECFGKEK